MALLFDDERATKAVLSFLRKTKVGQMVAIPPRGGEEEEEGEEENSEGTRVEVGGEEAPYLKLVKGGASGGGRLQGAKRVSFPVCVCVFAFWYAGVPCYDGRTPLRRGGCALGTGTRE